MSLSSNYPFSLHRAPDGLWSVCTAYAVLAYRVDEQSAQEAVGRAFPGFPLIEFEPTDPVEFQSNWKSAISFQVNALHETLDEFQVSTDDELERLSDELEALRELSDDREWRQRELVRLRRELAAEEARALQNQQQLLNHLHTSTTPEWVKKQNARAILGNPTPRILQLRQQIEDLEE